MAALAVGAADGIEIIVDNGRGQIKTRFAQGSGELPCAETAVGADGGVFHLGDIAIVIIHAADDIDMGGAGGGGQGAAGDVKGGLRLPGGYPDGACRPVVAGP